MRQILLIVLLVTGALLSMQSCKKEYSFINIGIEKEISGLSYSEKKFSITNQTDVLLKTPTGLKLHFPAAAFVNKNGQPVTDNITIEIKEILRPDAMILHHMPTVSNGKPLESGGEFFIGVTSGNEKLKLAPGVLIRLDLPKTGYSQDGMQVFNGVKSSSTGPDTINWVQNNNSGNTVVRLDSSSLQTTLFCDDINWINCDRVPPEQLIEFTINCGNTPNADSTFSFVHLSGRNTVMSTDRYTQGPSVGLKVNVIESPATIVGICLINGELYSSFSTTSLKRGQSATMSFSKTTLEQLKQKLKALR